MSLSCTDGHINLVRLNHAPVVHGDFLQDVAQVFEDIIGVNWAVEGHGAARLQVSLFGELLMIDGLPHGLHEAEDVPVRTGSATSRGRRIELLRLLMRLRLLRLPLRVAMSGRFVRGRPIPDQRAQWSPPSSAAPAAAPEPRPLPRPFRALRL